MANYNKLDADSVRMIRTLSERGATGQEIAAATKWSKPTVQRVLKGYYLDDGTYIGSPDKQAKANDTAPVETPQDARQEPEGDMLQDKLRKILYESCMTNHLLRQLLEKWQ